jgi:hypothetical protein
LSLGGKKSEEKNQANHPSLKCLTNGISFLSRQAQSSENTFFSKQEHLNLRKGLFVCHEVAEFWGGGGGREKQLVATLAN